jgi:hypothetical protein
MSQYKWKLWFILALAKTAVAGTITFSGLISQSTADGTGPAVNNPALNNIMDGDNYVATINSQNQILSPGLYNTPDLTLSFLDAGAGVSETAFNSVSVSVIVDGSFYDISVMGCLSTGSSCNTGNELDANFRIANTDLGSSNAPAFAIPLLNPSLDLLEDDGGTDIQGSVAKFGSASVPEPGTIAMATIGLAGLVFAKMRRQAASSATALRSLGTRKVAR